MVSVVGSRQAGEDVRKDVHHSDAIRAVCAGHVSDQSGSDQQHLHLLRRTVHGQNHRGDSAVQSAGDPQLESQPQSVCALETEHLLCELGGLRVLHPGVTGNISPMVTIGMMSFSLISLHPSLSGELQSARVSGSGQQHDHRCDDLAEEQLLPFQVPLGDLRLVSQRLQPDHDTRVRYPVADLDLDLHRYYNLVPLGL